MKKTLLLVLVSLGFFLTSGAQILELYHNGELFPMGDIITVDGDPAQAELEAHITVKNISNNTVVVKCRKIEEALVEGGTNYFCWSACFPPFVYLSPVSVTIEPGQSTEEFSGHYSPNGNNGITQMMYSFFDEGNPNDSTYFRVHYFASSVGINDLAKNEVTVSNPYPNPASNQVSFDYNLPANVSNATISVHNLLGAAVKQINLFNASGKVTFNVNDLNDGIYFYSIMVNNEVLETKRLVISR